MYCSIQPIAQPAWSGWPIASPNDSPPIARSPRWRVKRKMCAKDANRSSGFEVPKTSNFGPRTLVHPRSVWFLHHLLHLASYLLLEHSAIETSSGGMSSAQLRSYTETAHGLDTRS